MAASSGAEPIASASEVRYHSALRSAVGGVPHASLVEGGQHVDGLASVAARRQVGGAEAHHATGGLRVEAEVGEQAAVAVLARELGRDVTRPVDVDDPRPTARRAEHGEVPAAALLQLEVQSRTAAAQRADQLADQAFALDAPDARHDGEPWVQIEGQGVLAGLDHQSFHAHAGGSAPDADLKQNMGQTTQSKGHANRSARRGHRGAGAAGGAGAEAPPEPPAREAIRLRRSPTSRRSARRRAHERSSEELAAGE